MAGFSATHYAYIAGPNGVREPVNLLDFRGIANEARRFMIHSQIENGFLVAACPFGVEINSIADLKQAMEWIDDGRR